jgi:recombination protein RecT
MANEVAKKDAEAAVAAPQKTIKGMLANPDTAWGKELAKVLPSPKEVARFMSCALDQLADPKVGRKLAACTLPSFYNAIKKSARSGILPDGVNAYLIPYGNECTLQFSFRGLCDMSIREGIALKFDSDVVRVNDIFKWSNGQLVEHTIVDWDEEERGEIVGVWGRAYLPDVNGQYNPDLHVDERMSKSQADKIRSKSQNPNGVWGEWYEEMMKKSCVKRMFKRMRNTPTLAEAISEDNKEFNLGGSVDRTNRVSAADILGGGKLAKKDKDGDVIDIPVADSEAE